MAASVQCRPQDRSLGMLMKEVDVDLAIFLEMRNREMGKNGFCHIHNSDGFDDSTASNPESSVVSDTILTNTLAFAASNPESSVVSDTILTNTLVKMTPADKFLDPDNQKSDFDWLLTPPCTPSFPSLEMSVQSAGSQVTTSSGQPAAQISKLGKENPPDAPSSLYNTSAQPITSTSEFSSVSRNIKPVSARQKSTAPRSATPTGRSGLPAASKPSRASTPTSRVIAASSKSTAPPVRTSTPARVIARTSTPPARSSIPSTSKSTTRSATPTLKSSISSSANAPSAPPGRSSSVTKAAPTISKNTGSRGGIIPIVKSRAKSSDVSVISTDVDSNLRMTRPRRPSSASRGRSIAFGSQSSSSNSNAGEPRQKSSSPSRGRVKDGGALEIGKTVISRSRGYSLDDVNPVLIGTKMVERVVNMRKLAPPKHDNDDSRDNSAKSSSSQDNSGFGRSLSKKSLDMAIRHMDIRRSISGNLKAIVTSIPPPPLSSRQTASTKTWTTSASDSPLATCSNTSSEPSVHNITYGLDGNDVEVYDIGTERVSSPSN